MNPISWTDETFARFKAAYKEAHDLAHPEFTFEGNVYVTKYALYLIEYLTEKTK